MLGNALLVGLAGTVFARLADADPADAFASLTSVLGVAAASSVFVSLRIGPLENHAVTVPKP